MATRGRRDLASPLEQLSLVVGIDRDGEGLTEQDDRLVLAAECDRPFRGGPEGDPSLCGECIRLWPVGRIRVGGEVMAGQPTGDLVRPEALEEPGRCQVTGLPIALRQGVVRDLADQSLDESVLAPFGRAGIGLEREQLALDERPQTGLDLVLADTRDRGETSGRETLAENGGVGDERAVGRRQTVKPAGDQGGERLRDRQVDQIADWSVDAVVDLEPTLGDEHPDRFDCVQRHAFRAPDDRALSLLRESRRDPGQEPPHVAFGEGLEMNRRGAPNAGAARVWSPTGKYLSCAPPTVRNMAPRNAGKYMATSEDQCSQMAPAPCQMPLSEPQNRNRWAAGSAKFSRHSYTNFVECLHNAS